MDARKILIIAKEKDVTKDVQSYHISDSKAHLTYRTRVFDYNLRNVQILQNPKKINVDNKVIFIDGTLILNILDVLRFNEWIKIFFNNGDTHICKFNCFTAVENKNVKNTSYNILDYYKGGANNINKNRR